MVVVQQMTQDRFRVLIQLYTVSCYVIHWKLCVVASFSSKSHPALAARKLLCFCCCRTSLLCQGSSRRQTTCDVSASFPCKTHRAREREPPGCGFSLPTLTCSPRRTPFGLIVVVSSTAGRRRLYRPNRHVPRRLGLAVGRRNFRMYVRGGQMLLDVVVILWAAVSIDTTSNPKRSVEPETNSRSILAGIQRPPIIIVCVRLLESFLPKDLCC